MMATRVETSKGSFHGEYVIEHRDSAGNLIVRDFNIDFPKVPACLKARCILQFMRDCIFAALVQVYHAKRMQYAQLHRHDKILLRYRTGDPSPKTIWQAIHANIKLRCPICRRYNVDPLLFGGKNNGSKSNSN